MHDSQTSIPKSTIVVIENGNRAIHNNENILITPSTQHTSQLLFDATTTTTTATANSVANVLRSNNTIIIDDNNDGGVVINNNNVHSIANVLPMMDHINHDDLFVDCSNHRTTTSVTAATLIATSTSSIAIATTSSTNSATSSGDTTSLQLINNATTDQSYSNESMDLDMDIDLKDGRFIDDDETSQGTCVFLFVYIFICIYYLHIPYTVVCVWPTYIYIVILSLYYSKCLLCTQIVHTNFLSVISDVLSYFAGWSGVDASRYYISFYYYVLLCWLEWPRR